MPAKSFVRCGCLLATTIGLATPAAGQPCDPPCVTCVSGPVNGTWAVAGSPYCVTGDLAIGDLTIQPGVTVLVDGPWTFNVGVRLRVMGSEAMPVTITAKEASGRWHGISFVDTGPGSELNHCTISRSDATAIRITGAGVVPPAFRYCTISDNIAPLRAAAVRAEIPSGQTLQMEGCIIERNTVNPSNTLGSYSAGAVYLNGSALLIGCTFDHNECYGSSGCSSAFSSTRGSALYCEGAGTVELRVCQIVNGRSHTTYNTVSTLGCIGVGSGFSRAALYYAGTGSLILRNSIVACNSATGTNPQVGGLWVESGDVIIENCSIAGNMPTGVYRNGGTATVRNSILFWNNAIPTGYGPQFVSVAGGTIDFAFSDVQGGAPPGNGNTSTNPGFVGGSPPAACCVQTFMLVPASGCVDTGDPALLDACRPLGLGLDRSDMGAFGGPGNCPWGPVLPCYPDCDRSCTLNVSDFVCFSQMFAGGEPGADCNNDTALNVLDFVCFQQRFAAGCP